MKYKFQYQTEEEKQTIINNNSDKVLIEYQYLIDGTFLIFADVQPLENALQDIKNNTDLIILKQEGLI